MNQYIISKFECKLYLYNFYLKFTNIDTISNDDLREYLGVETDLDLNRIKKASYWLFIKEKI